MREVMDAFTESNIKKIIVKSSSQVGKTEVLLNIVGRFAQLDPCSIMIVQPTLEMAQDLSKSRLSKMIADTKSLTPLFYEKLKTRDANQTILSKFFTGGRVVLTGANSPAGLASRPIRILLCDEVDRFPADCGGEGDPIGLAEKRTSNYWNAKVALFSTPTTKDASRIEAEYNLGTREVWTYQCPNCQEWHTLDYQQMQVDFQKLHDEAGNTSVVVKSVVWQCPDCGFEFTEREMKNAPQRYEAQNPDALSNGVRSFSLNAFSSPWLSWSDIMREWLEAKGNPSREAVVMNTRFGESYEFTGNHEDENEFLKRRVEYEAELPDGVLLLTAAVDVQADRLEFEIAGWSAGFTRYGIQRGIIRGKPNFPVTWAALDKILDRVFFFADGTGMTVARTFIDSGFSTANVYEYCRRNFSKGRFPIKGKGGAGISLIHKYTRVENAGVMLVILGVDDGKSEVMNRLSIVDGDGRMIFPEDDEFLGQRGYNEKFFKQLLAERRVVRKSGGVISVVWENVKRARNESLDLCVYNMAAALSCAGNNPESFWRSRHALLIGEPVTKPKRKRSTKFIESDLYDET